MFFEGDQRCAQDSYQIDGLHRNSHLQRSNLGREAAVASYGTLPQALRGLHC